MLLGVSDVEVSMNRWVAAMRLVGVGFFIGTSIVMGVFIGRWLDNRFGTEPILVIVGLILGLVVAFYGVFRMLIPLLSNKQDKENG